MAWDKYSITLVEAIMRFKTIITEDADPLVQHQDTKIVGEIREKCVPFLQAIDHQTADFILYRGIKNDDSDDFIYRGPVRNRLPKDTSELTQYLFDNYFQKKYNLDWRPRSQGLFCAGKYFHASGYSSKVYSVYPVGPIKILWSEAVTDLYADCAHQLDELPAFTCMLYLGYTERDFQQFLEDNMDQIFAIAQNSDKFKDSLYQRITGGMLYAKIENGEDTVVGQAIIQIAVGYLHASVNGLSNFSLEDIKNELIRKMLDLFNKQARYWVKLDTYVTGDLKSAIQAGNEIMVHCNGYMGIRVRPD